MDKKRYLVYIGEQYHTDPDIKIRYERRSTGELLVGKEIKIGITRPEDGIDRFNQLNRTNAPIGWTPLEVFDAKDEETMWRVEGTFKNMWSQDRVRSNGLTEYYKDYDAEKYPLAIRQMEIFGLKSVKEDYPEWFDESDEGAKVVRKVSRDKLKEDGLKEKINEYLVGESFSFTRPNDFVQTITIKENGIHSSTNDKMYDIGKVHFAFADSFRQKLIEDGKITKEEWNWNKVKKEHRGSTVNFWHNAKNNDDKTIMDRLIEVDKEKNQ